MPEGTRKRPHFHVGFILFFTDFQKSTMTFASNVLSRIKMKLAENKVVAGQVLRSADILKGEQWNLLPYWVWCWKKRGVKINPRIWT